MSPRAEPAERTCIVTRRVRPAEELLRFVLDPENRVLLDLRHRLPGRGVWVTARSECVETAERKRLFGRAFKAEAIVEPGLAGRVEAQLRNATTGALSLARKAGVLVLGFAKVERAIADGEVAALIHAADAGADGVIKLDAAARKQRGDGPPIPIIRILTEEEMGLALGRPHVIHAALLAGRASDHLLHQFAALARFFEREPREGDDLPPLIETATPSAEHQGL